jgi:dTDP-4-dehydrorhamnose 3,5-epimerase
MQFERTGIPDVMLVRPRVFGDARGLLFESWEERKFAAAGCDAKFVQDSHSRSTKHTLRGLHYQIQHAQGKLVRVVAGTVFDVAVDIRGCTPRRAAISCAPGYA